MTQKTMPDMSCVPYRRKGLYFVLTTPFLVILLAVLIYLWTFSPVLSAIFVSFYLVMCFFQAYCCVYQDCPYVGGFCPAIAGIMPSSVLAKLFYGKKIAKSRRSFDIQAMIAIGGWLGLALFPVPWIAKLSSWLAAGYVVYHIVYYLIFGLTICPVCAIRNTCPGGRLHKIVLRNRRRTNE